MADVQLTDPLGQTFFLTDSQWDYHIVRSHPDVDGGREAAEQAIISPKSIWISKSDPDRRIYFGNGPSQNLMIAVVVDVAQAFIVTAYLATRETGASLVWQPEIT